MIFLFLFGLIFIASAKELSLESVQIKGLNLAKCTNQNYPVIVSDVNAKMVNSKVHVTGSLSSEVDLDQPIKASVYLKRYIWGVWIPVVCVDKIGSCNYDDLCEYGIPPQKNCSQTFIDNKVPCRCPIGKGNYTIKPQLEFTPKQKSLLTGYYKGQVIVSHNSKLLSCYNFKFQLVDNGNSEYCDESKENSIATNEVPQF